MRILFYTLLFSVILFARANPFEATDTFEIQRQQVLQERVDKKTKDEQLKQEALKQQQAEKERLKQQQVQEERLKQEILKQEMLKKQLEAQKRYSKSLVKKEKTKSKTKPKTKCKTDYTLNILPFITINSTQKSFQLQVKKPYKLINQDINKKKRKFIFDFSGHASFYTKRKVMCHPYFESLTIGTHLKKNFFRVVIVVRENILNYKETIDAKNGTVSIKRK